MLGVSEEKFWDSVPVDLDPYRKMDEMQEKRLDYHMWLMGAYVTNAVSVAVSRSLSKKSSAKYLEKPFSLVEQEHERDPKQDFQRFAAWAIVYNENFKNESGQGK